MNNESKPRIGVVIKDCLECSHCEKFRNDSDRSGYLLLCDKANKVIYRDYCSRNLNEISKDEFIPEWCPLDCYSGENEIYGMNKKTDNMVASQWDNLTPYVRYK